MASRIVIVLASITLFLAGLAVWVARQALDTDQWVETSSSLVRDPAVQKTTAAYLSDQLVGSTQVTSRLEEALPDQFSALAAPLSGFIGDAAENAALRALQSGAFQQLWEDAQRRTHEQLVAVIEGDERQVYLDLRPMLGQVATRVGLGPQAVANVESQGVLGRVKILEDDQVKTIRVAGRGLRALAWVLALLAIGLFTASVWLARGRRREALLQAGLGIAVAGLLLLAMRRVLGGDVVAALADGGASTPAAQATWNVATSLLREIAGSFVVLGILLVAAALFAGPTSAATRLRQMVGPTLRDRPGVAYSIVAVVLLLVLLAGILPASGRLLGLLIYSALAVGGVVTLRRQIISELPPPREAT